MSQNCFDEIAEHYDEIFPSHVRTHYLNKRVRFIKGIIRHGSVLDVGCGTGLLANSLERQGFTVSGVDSSPQMLEQAKKRGISAKLGTSDSLPFKTGQFDLAVSVSVLHHVVEKSGVAKSVKEMVRVVKSGQAIVIWDHNPNNPYWPILMRRLPQDRGQTRLVPLGEVIAALREVNVNEMKIYRKGFIPDFMPSFLMPLIKGIEFVCERLPLVKYLAASNVVVAYKDG